MITLTQYSPDHRLCMGKSAPQLRTEQSQTLLDPDGAPYCVFGIVSPWEGYGMAWCEERDQGSMMRYPVLTGRYIVRAWKVWTGTGQYRRIDAVCPEAHHYAQRLLGHLGFHLLCSKPAYYADGATALEYVWFPREGQIICVPG